MIFVVEEQPNPSSDFFVLPAVQHLGERVERVGFGAVPPIKALLGAWVVFVRYVPSAWRRAVEAAQGELAGVVLFMDDDVLDPRAATGMPWRYRAKLWRLGARHHAWLRRIDAALWVSTPHLQAKYADWHPRLVEPGPIPLPEPGCRVFYHGSASHGAEIRWLHPVMAEVLRRDERVSFEIVGGQDVYRRYRRLPRVTVVHPMKWPAYQAFLAQPGRDIGLAPQLPSPFNAARSHTKAFDITRAGAVGIYAADSACGQHVHHGEDGWVLPMQPQAWVEGILALANDRSLRAQLLTRARTRFAAPSDAPIPGDDGSASQN